MRKMLLTPLIVCMVALLSLLFMPVHATKPIPASGIWTYTFPSTFIETREADGNTFIYADEDGLWHDGTFLGTSYDVFTVVVHPSGFWNVRGLSFFDGTVDGKEGSLVILFVGKKTGEPFLWSGQWVILSGTGELADLHGQGTWWGPGALEPWVPGDLEYSGQIHFKPD
jgi:hypothetical protein